MSQFWCQSVSDFHHEMYVCNSSKIFCCDFQVSLEDKLSAINLAQTQPGSGTTEQPNLNSMVTLLTQALQSQDKKLLLVSKQLEFITWLLTAKKGTP